jgi:hypothetical protein
MGLGLVRILLDLDLRAIFFVAAGFCTELSDKNEQV